MSAATRVRGPQAKPTRDEVREYWRKLRRLADRGDPAALAELIRLTQNRSTTE